MDCIVEKCIAVIQENFIRVRDELNQLKVNIFLDNLIREGTIKESDINRSSLSESAYIYVGDLKIRISCHAFNYDKFTADHTHELRLDTCLHEEKEEIINLIENTQNKIICKYNKASLAPCLFEQVEGDLNGGKRVIRLKLAA